MNWDTIISAGIIIALVLGFWAKVTRQTIPQVVMGFVEMIKGKTEDGTEYMQENIIYE